MQREQSKGAAPLYLIAVSLGVFALQTLTNLVSDKFAHLFDYRAIDPADVFMCVTVHHLCQLALCLLAIGLIYKASGLRFYLKPRLDGTGVRYTVSFALIVLVGQCVAYAVQYATGAAAPYAYALDARNVTATLAFQLLISGTAEEVIFRALPIALLTKGLRTDDRRLNHAAVLIASLLFALAHVGWTLNPFTVSFSWFQVVYAFVLGLAYGVTYIKAKSVVYPVIMHGLSNFIYVGVGYIFAALFG